MRVCWAPCAPNVLLVARALHPDRILHCAHPRGVERPHVEDVHAVHLTEKFEAFETSGLVVVCWDGANGSSWGDEVRVGFDFCWLEKKRVSAWMLA